MGLVVLYCRNGLSRRVSLLAIFARTSILVHSLAATLDAIPVEMEIDVHLHPKSLFANPFLNAEFQILQPEVILLVGTMAIETFFGKVKLEEVIGTYLEREGKMFLPLPHPSGVSRWLNNPEHLKLHQRALEILAAWRVTYNL